MLNLFRLFMISAKRTISFEAINNIKLNYLKVKSKRTVIQYTLYTIILHMYLPINQNALLKNDIFLV